MEPQPLSIEALRKVVQTRLLEFQAYQQMEQALEAVMQADDVLKEHHKQLDDVQKAIAAKEQEFTSLEQTVAEKEARLSQRLVAQQSSAKAQLEEITAEVAKKTETLKNWQAHLAAVEQQHKETLATWQARIEQARAEHVEAQAKADSAKQQLAALAALVKA